MNIKSQRGITLVELMIAVTISLLILLVITQVYMSSFNTQRTQDDVGRLNETTRFSFDLLSRELRKAGFRNKWQQPPAGSGSAENFCKTATIGSAILGKNDPATIDPATSNFTGGSQISIANHSDVVRARFYGEDATATSSVVDCHGYPVAANTLVEDTLFVALNNNVPTLFCNTTNATPATATHPGKLPLVTGVESLQLLYGEDTDADGIINRYVPWNLVTNADNILGVKASIIVSSLNNVAATTNPTTALHHFYDTYPASTNVDDYAIFTPPADRHLRKMLSTEIATRNFRYCE